MTEMPKTFRAKSAPEPEIYVPMWSDDTPKAEQFWNETERAMVAESQQRREEWQSRFAYAARANNGGL